MKTRLIFIFLLCSMAFWASCTISEIEPENIISTSSIIANIQEDISKVSTDGQYCYWEKLDSISVFSPDSKSIYLYSGTPGQSSGEFTLIDKKDIITPKLTQQYAIYPDNTETSVVSDGVIQYQFPNVQHYAANTFGKGVSVLVASSDMGSNKFQFKIVTGNIVVRLYGAAQIKSVSLKGNNGELLSGPGKISLSEGSVSCDMSEGNGTEIKLLCEDQGTKIQPTKDEPTLFWISLPPVEFSKGFTINIEDKNGNVISKKTKTTVKIQSGHVLPMSAAEMLDDSSILDSGVCGPNLTWRLFDNGLLKISGTGRSYDYVKGLLDGKTRKQIEDYTGPSYYGFQEGKNYDHEHGVYVAPWYKYRAEVDFVEYTSKSAYDAHNPNGWQYTKVSIDPGITYVGDWMFYRCCAEELTLPEGVEEIADWGIRYSPTLKKITIPSSVKIIGDNGISRNEVAEEINLGTNIERIGENALGQNSKVKRICLPKSCVSMGLNPFMANSQMEYLDLGSVNVITDRCCVSNKKLETVVIPNTVKRIEEAAFYNCDLRMVSIPASVDTIYHIAFYQCANLEDVYIDSQKIADNVDLGTQNGYLTAYLKHLYVNASISCKYAESTMHFDGVDGDYKKYTPWKYVEDDKIVQAGTICSGVYYIIYKTDVEDEYKLVIDSNGTGEIASSIRPWNTYSKKIVELYVGAGVSITSGYYFSGQSTIRKAEIASSVISDRFMINCTGLQELTLHEGLETIPDYAFYGASISHLVIPNSVKQIGQSAFNNGNGEYPMSAEIGSGVQRIGVTAFYPYKSVSIPSDNHIVSIGDRAFYFSTGEWELNLPAVETIGERAFNSATNYSAIHIGNRINSIGGYAFRSNTSDVYINRASSEITIGSNAFYKTPPEKIHYSAQ